MPDDSVLDRLTLGVPYRSGPLARTDLHAGGIFFCVIYEEFLQFEQGSRVRRWAEIIDEMSPLDDEAEGIRASREVGVYRVNHRGYLECLFTDLELCGMLSAQAPDLLAVQLWRPRMGVSFGRVYRRDVG